MSGVCLDMRVGIRLEIRASIVSICVSSVVLTFVPDVVSFVRVGVSCCLCCLDIRAGYLSFPSIVLM